MNERPSSAPIDPFPRPNPEPTRTVADRGAHISEASVTQVKASFESFYSAERAGLVRAVSIVERNPIVAAELVDEAMVRAYQRWSQVSELQRPGGWVYRVAINLGRSRFRRLRLDVKYRFVTPPSEETRAAEDEFFARSEESPLISAVLDLPSNQRSVVVARILMDYSEAEVAAALDIPHGTVKSRLSRALTTLRNAVPELAPAVATYAPQTLQSQGTNS